MRRNITIGIYGIASQSGMAYFADVSQKGYHIVGYNRPSSHGNATIQTIIDQGGVFLERPENSNHEQSRFIPLEDNVVTSDLSVLVDTSDIIIIALPSIYQQGAVQYMAEEGLRERNIPILLSPSRTFASPYLWRVLGDHYPIVCFSTCPYSCKVPQIGTSLIKRRKRTWVASIEGCFQEEHRQIIKELFPQAALTRIPALTSLNNIGAVFHCATYVLNYEEIVRRQSAGLTFSFYMEGIAQRPEVGEVLYQIDQIRLSIAAKLGLNIFGLKEKPREDVWRKLTNGLRALEAENEDDIEILRSIRKQFMQYLNNSILSAPHWLDITYGVVRDPNESFSETIGRTPTYQKNSVPQLRYLTEDVPTGLVPFEALAKQMGVECQVISRIIDKCNTILNKDMRQCGRNLEPFTEQQIIDYLKGNNFI